VVEPTWGGVEAAEDVGDGGFDEGEGGFDEGSKGTIPTGTMLQFLWFLGHSRWIFSFFNSSKSLSKRRNRVSFGRSAHWSGKQAELVRDSSE
jgi:hypothetical protein